MKYLYLLVFLSVVKTATAQDMIYFADGSKIPGKVTEITAEKLKFRNMANPTGPIYSKATSNVLIAFSASGSFLTFDKTKAVAQSEINEFLTTPLAARPYDILVDNSSKVTPVLITQENDQEIKVNNQGIESSIRKDGLAFIIRSDGTHQLIKGPEQALPILSQAKPNIKNLVSENVAAPGTAKIAAAPERQPVVSDNTAPAPEPSRVNTEARAETPAEPTVTRPQASTNNSAAITAAKPESDEISSIDMKMFSRKAVNKTEEFTNYLQNIASGNASVEAAKKSINLACDLFLSEDSRVEVSSVNRGITNKYKVRAYLNRLNLASGNFDKIEIEYADINYASKFRKGADGNYYGVVTFVQKFKGFVDGKVVYGDVTKRNITVVLKQYDKAVNGEAVSGWDVYLDDVGVVETKKL